MLKENITTRLHPCYVDDLDVEATFLAVSTIFERESVEEGLSPDRLIADITGGTKTMSAGMLLAALTTGAGLEYVESKRDSQGQPIPDTLRVVLVDTTFYLQRE